MRSKLGILVIAIGGCTTPAGDAPVDTAKVEAAKVEPAKAEIAKVEIAKAEPTKAEPAKAEPAKVEPDAKADVVPSTPPGKDDPWVVAQRVGPVAIGELVDGSVIALSPRDVAIAPPGAGLGPAKTLPSVVDERGRDLDASQLESIGGRWPDDVWVVEVDYDMRDGTTWHVHALDPTKGWQRKDEAIDGVMVAVLDSFSPWKGGTTLARRRWRADETAAPGDGGDDEDAGAAERAQAKYDRKLKKAAKTAKPAFVVLGGTAEPPPATLAATAGPILALPSGDLHAGCDPTGAFVHRNPNGEERSVPMPALANPGTQLESAILVGRTPDELYCIRSANGTSIVRFDGTKWHDVPAFAGDLPVRAASKAPGGALFLLLGSDPTVMTEGMMPGNDIVRLGDDGAWESVALDAVHAPPGKTIARVDPMQIVARGRDDVWIAGLVPPAQKGDDLQRADWVVLHSRAPSSVLALTPVVVE